MKREQITDLLAQAATWRRGVYRLDDEERADIREGLVELERGEVASDNEVRATFEVLRRA
jgi:predicted transcriptional regulator